MTDRSRVHKIIAQAGILSRRAAEDAIRAGRVRLNGQVLLNVAQTCDPETDVIELDGKKVSTTRPETILFRFYKPRGIITSKKDEHQRPSVADYFKDFPELDPVGRLDYDSEGLLLMTNDGDLLLHLTHPRYEVKKRYEVTLDQELSTATLKLLQEGITLDDGPGRFPKIDLITPKTYAIEIAEGRNRFIRRMMAAVHTEVLRLVRTHLGPYTLEGLKPGNREQIPYEKS